jgi:hypothetical protein
MIEEHGIKVRSYSAISDPGKAGAAHDGSSTATVNRGTISVERSIAEIT